MTPDTEGVAVRRTHRRVAVAWLMLFPLSATILGSAMYLGSLTEDANARADAATAQLASAKDQSLDFATQLKAACEAGVLDGPVCQDAEDVVETAPSAPPPVVVVDLTEQVAAAVAEDIAACIQSGACVGPAGAPGATGEPGEDGETGPAGPGPSSAELTAAVVEACGTVIDCTVTPDEVAEAVAAYCGQDSEPCGHRWTEAEIYKIANRATVDYLSGRDIWCPSEDSVPNDQPFGPCRLSVG